MSVKSALWSGVSHDTYLNRSHIISPDSSIDSIRTPVAASFLENAALRDLALHSSHAACVDARGDVYQWGDGFFGPSASASGTKDRGPTLTLKGKVKSLHPCQRCLW